MYVDIDEFSLSISLVTTGSGATAVVQVARCVKNNMKVAIKRIDLERCGSTIEELQVRKSAAVCDSVSALPAVALPFRG